MKKLIKSVLVLSLFAFVVTSCSEDEVILKAPVISDLEVGGVHNADGSVTGQGTAYIGDDLHIEANIVAEGKIAYIMVEIHDEKSGTEVLDQKFVKGFEGLINSKFHEHVDIPATTKPGTYHFHLKVVDQQGKTTEVESDLELKSK